MTLRRIALTPVIFTRSGASSTTTGSTMNAGFPLSTASSLAMRAPRLDACSPKTPDLRSPIIASPTR